MYVLIYIYIYIYIPAVTVCFSVPAPSSTLLVSFRPPSFLSVASKQLALSSSSSSKLVCPFPFPPVVTGRDSRGRLSAAPWPPVSRCITLSINVVASRFPSMSPVPRCITLSIAASRSRRAACEVTERVYCACTRMGGTGKGILGLA